jgi:hypothetical protein
MHLYFRKSFYILFLFIGQFLFSKVIYVDDNASEDGDGTSWATAHKFLQDALASAVDGDEIWVAEGTYRPDQGAGKTAGDREASFTISKEIELIGGFIGQENSAEPMGKPDNTILSGKINDDSDYWSLHVVYVREAKGAIRNCSIKYGNANGYPNGPNFYKKGSGLYVSTPLKFEIQNCIIEENLRHDFYIAGTDKLLITKSIFYGDRVGSHIGGDVVVKNSIFAGIDSSIDTSGEPNFLNITNLRGITNASRYYSNAWQHHVVVFLNSIGANASSGVDHEGRIVPTWSHLKTMLTKIVPAFPGDEQREGIYYAPNISSLLNYKDDYSSAFSSINFDFIYTGAKFLDVYNPKGKDGLWFTNDDGLQLVESSPGVDQGSTPHLFNTYNEYTNYVDGGNLELTDIVGRNRVNGSSVDIGAYEYYLIPQYNVDETNSSLGTINGGGLYYRDTEAILQAYPSNGYSFLKWDGDLDSSKNPIKVKVINDLSVSALFISNSIFNLSKTASSLNHDWYSNSWFGTFYATDLQWIYHRLLGWLYVYPVDDTSYWMWSDKYGWLWIHSLYYPNLYSNDLKVWLKVDTVTGLMSVFTKSTESWNDYSSSIYNIEIATEPKTAGVASGGRNYAKGTLASLNATPDVYHTFLHWMNGNQIVSTDHNYSFVVDENVSLVAIFEPKIPLEEMAEFTLEVSPANASDFIIYDSDSNLLDKNTSFSVPVGEVLTVRPSYGYDYYFSHWEMPNGTRIQDEEFSIRVDDNISIELKLNESYKLTLTSTGETLLTYVLLPESDEPIFFEESRGHNVSYWKPNANVSIKTFGGGFRFDLPEPWVRFRNFENTFTADIQMFEHLELQTDVSPQ